MVNFQLDEFNQYVYVRAANLLGLRVKKTNKKNNFRINKEIPHKRNSRLGEKIIKSFLAAIIKIRKPVLILDGYFKNKDALRIFFYSLGRVAIVPSRFITTNIEQGDSNLTLNRSSLCIQEKDQFDMFVNLLLQTSFPKSFFEDFQAILTKNSNWLGQISVLGTATCIRSNDNYKIAAAELNRKGGTLLGFQHGGASNCFSAGRFEYIETGYVSRYYGWGEQFNFGMGAPKLRGIRKNINRAECTSILFVSTGHPLHNFWMNVRENANCFSEYLEEQFLFYETLPDEVKHQFLYRPYMQDYGWRYKERWSAKFNGTVIFDTNINLYHSLERARIFVSDHLSTTWLEALYSDLPIIMYIEINRLALLPDLEKLLVELIGVGVIHESPESAAIFVSDVYDNVNEWWNKEETIKAVQKLKRYFISESKNFVSDWSKELLSHRS